MRICYLAGAGSVHTQRWVAYFANKGHDVHLISVDPVGGVRLPNVTLHQIRAVRSIELSVPTTMIQIRTLLSKIGPDVLHAHYASTYGFYGALCRFHPFVLTAWGSDILVEPRKSNLAVCTVRVALAVADSVTCDAEHVIRAMVRLGVQRQKVRLICFGVDTEKFDPSERDSDFRQKLGLPSDSLVVISLRGLRQIYDVESLVRAAPMVLAKVPQVRFIVAGDGEERSKLQGLAKSLGVADSIRFVGSVPNDRLPRYLASADVYVSTSLSDAGIAASTAEAMASQLPVVITDIADNRNWVKDGEGGFIVPPRNTVALAERIIYLLQNQGARHSFGVVNRRIIRERNEYHEQMQIVERLYEELIQKC